MANIKSKIRSDCKPHKLTNGKWKCDNDNYVWESLSDGTELQHQIIFESELEFSTEEEAREYCNLKIIELFKTRI